MMNHIWYTFRIPSVRNYPDMILEHYNVAALPLFNVIYIRGQTGRCMFKIYSQVLYSSEINIFIRLIDIIILRILSDIFVYQFSQVISALLKRISDNICTDTISVIRITGLIISALVNPAASSHKPMHSSKYRSDHPYRHHLYPHCYDTV